MKLCTRSCFWYRSKGTPSGFVLRAGQSVTVYTGQGTPAGSQLYFGRSPGEYAAIWNNDGDCAYLVDDQGNLIKKYCW